jgi:hypothetical protein
MRWLRCPEGKHPRAGNIPLASRRLVLRILQFPRKSGKVRGHGDCPIIAANRSFWSMAVVRNAAVDRPFRCLRFRAKDTTMKATFHIAAALTALLTLTVPAAAQTVGESTPPSSEGTAASATPAAETPAPADTTAEEEANASWKKGRPITIQYLRARRTSAASTCSRPRRIGVEFKGFKLDFGAAFTSQAQDLSHRNTAAPNVVNGVNANQLQNIGFGFTTRRRTCPCTHNLRPASACSSPAISRRATTTSRG